MLYIWNVSLFPWDHPREHLHMNSPNTTMGKYNPWNIISPNIENFPYQNLNDFDLTIIYPRRITLSNIYQKYFQNFFKKPRSAWRSGL